MKKVPGCSLIEVNGVVCEFIAVDKSHTLMEDIESLSLRFGKRLKSHWLDIDNAATSNLLID